MSKHPLISDSLLEAVNSTLKSKNNVVKVQEALSPMPMIAALRIGRDAGPSGSRKRRSQEEIAAAKKERSEYKTQQAFEKLKPHPGSKAKTVQTTFRTGMFGRKLKAKPEDFRKIPGKKARPDLQFEETQLDEGGIRPTKAALKHKLKQARKRNVDAWNDHEGFTAYRQPEAYRIGKQQRRDELMASGKRYNKIKSRYDKSKD